LRYTKYKHLDISNLKEIKVNNENLQEIPCWVRDCRNLKKFTAAYNSIKAASKNQLPASLVELDLLSNLL
jgi:Leucine-rich repeat (LRR) protein